MSKGFLSGLGLLWVATTLQANPKILADFGQTKPLQPYFKINTPHPGHLVKPNTLPVTGLPYERQHITAHAFPVKTKELTPGAFNPLTIHLPYLERPLFIIGSEPFSRQWLIRNLKRLSALNAVGLVVNIATSEELTSLKALAGSLTLYALPGSELARQFKLNHYPALLTKDRIAP